MRRLPFILFVSGFILAAAVTVFVTNAISAQYLDRQNSASNLAKYNCRRSGTSHLVKVQNNQMVPADTQAKICDTLTITNADPTLRLIAFGPHDNHQPYDGVTEKALGTNQSFTIVLNQLGTYSFHDHIEDVAHGDFTVVR